MTSRRKFLAGSLATTGLMTFGRPAPAVLRAAAAERSDQERILVVVELAGGNDGLNTVIPVKDDRYKAARPTLAIPSAEAISIGQDTALHPAMTGFADLLQQDRLAVVQGVGYPNPNRSHFESMDIWHTCQRKDAVRVDGWLGRYLESAAAQFGSTDPQALHFGEDKQPFALMSRQVRVPSVGSLDEFRLLGREKGQFATAVKQLADARRAPTNDLLGFVQSSTSSAIEASERIEQAAMSDGPSSAYPGNRLSRKLQTVARMINSGLKTRVYYVQLNGFDTHARQAGAHTSLLRQVSGAVSAFVNDMVAHGHGDRVVCLCFSEFGRRVQENASEGTDHGTAGPVFLAGSPVKAGLHGDSPDLSDLIDGDLKHSIDFRRVYASVLSGWLNSRAESSLRGQYEPLDLFDV